MSQHFKMEAEAIFSNLGVKVVTGNRFLGGFVGYLSDQISYVTSKVQKWVGHIKVLSDVATAQPQLAYAAFTKSLQHEWAFLMCVVPGCRPLFQELEHAIHHHFLPTVFGVEISTAEHNPFALPLRFGGLGVSNPVLIAPSLLDSSVHSTVTLVHSIVGATTFELDAHLETVSSARTYHHKYMDTIYTNEFDRLLPSFDPSPQCTILWTREHHISSWLSVMPVEKSQFDLSAQEFGDGLALKYREPLLCLPPCCDECGAPFTIEHALDCCMVVLLVGDIMKFVMPLGT